MKKKVVSIMISDVEGIKHPLDDAYIIDQLQKAYQATPKTERLVKLKKMNIVLENIFYSKFSL